MRDLTFLEMESVCGAEGSTSTPTCPPPRSTDVIECSQSELGKTANDLASFFDKMIEMLMVEMAKFKQSS